MAIESLRPFAPVIAEPSLRHWNEGSGSPVASTARRTGSPSPTFDPVGWERITGAEGLACTVNARSASSAGWNRALPCWDALTMTRPGSPVSLRLFPSRTAGPTPSRVTASPDVAFATMSNGASPTVWAAISANTISCLRRTSWAEEAGASTPRAARAARTGNAADRASRGIRPGNPGTATPRTGFKGSRARPSPAESR